MAKIRHQSLLHTALIIDVSLCICLHWSCKLVSNKYSDVKIFKVNSWVLRIDFDLFPLKSSRFFTDLECNEKRNISLVLIYNFLKNVNSLSSLALRCYLSSLILSIEFLSQNKCVLLVTRIRFGLFYGRVRHFSHGFHDINHVFCLPL